MERKVEYFDGEEITQEVIARASDIVKRSDNGWLFSIYDDSTTLDDLCMWHGSFPKEEHMILGEDWYLSYSLEDDITVFFNQWSCVLGDNGRFVQTIEMMREIKRILLMYKDITFSADMRHDTSYRFYESMVKRGYFTELSNEVDINVFSSSRLERFVEGVLQEYRNLDDYFGKCGYDEFPQNFHKLLFHCVDFKVTDRFVKNMKRRWVNKNGY